MANQFKTAKKYYDDVIYAPNEFIPFKPIGTLKEEDVYQAILYALKESNEATKLINTNYYVEVSNMHEAKEFYLGD